MRISGFISDKASGPLDAHPFIDQPPGNLPNLRCFLQHLSQDHTQAMPTPAKMDISARYRNGGNHCYRLSIDSSMSYTGSSSNSSSSGNCNRTNSGSSDSHNTEAPSSDTSGSRVFFHEDSPTGTPAATTTPVARQFSLPSGSGGCQQLSIGGGGSSVSLLGSPRWGVDLPSDSCKTGTAAGSTVAVEAAGLRHGRYVLSIVDSTPPAMVHAFHSVLRALPRPNLATIDRHPRCMSHHSIYIFFVLDTPQRISRT